MVLCSFRAIAEQRNAYATACWTVRRSASPGYLLHRFSSAHSRVADRAGSRDADLETFSGLLLRRNQRGNSGPIVCVVVDPVAAEEDCGPAIATSVARYFLDRESDHRRTVRRRTYSRRESLSADHAPSPGCGLHHEWQRVAGFRLSMLEARPRGRHARALLGRLHLAHHRSDVLPRLTRLYYDAHSVFLDDSDRRFGGNEFAFGHDVDDVLGEAGFAARTQHGLGRAFHAGRE